MADEFAIPSAALETLPDEQAFVKARSKWLALQERAFVEKFGLSIVEDT